MTSSPSETSEAPDTEGHETEAPDPLADYARGVLEAVSGVDSSADFGTVKIRVDAANWVDALTKARDELGLIFFSWLSAVDWANDVAVGGAPEDPVEERYEILCALSDLSTGRLVVFSADIDKESATIDSLVDVFAGANWHEREAAEMFGITFTGHPELAKLYLPDAFEGHPLQKSYPLLSREVKPWPGKVDVEDMPTTENPEA